MDLRQVGMAAGQFQNRISSWCYYSKPPSVAGLRLSKDSRLHSNCADFFSLSHFLSSVSSLNVPSRRPLFFCSMAIWALYFSSWPVSSFFFMTACPPPHANGYPGFQKAGGHRLGEPLPIQVVLGSVLDPWGDFCQTRHIAFKFTLLYPIPGKFRLKQPCLPPTIKLPISFSQSWAHMISR